MTWQIAEASVPTEATIAEEVMEAVSTAIGATLGAVVEAAT